MDHKNDSIRNKLYIQTKEDLKDNFDSIVGYLPQKEAIRSALVDPIKYRSYLEPQSGVCLFGHPGTGKSKLAQALAKELQHTFIQVRAGDLDSMYHGRGQQNVIETFKICKEERGSFNKNNNFKNIANCYINIANWCYSLI